MDDLSAESLLEEARQSTGLFDFGEDGFREGLGELVALYNGPARLTPRGRHAARRRLLELLCNRLRIHEAFRKHPEIRARPIRRPTVLTGLPRTGTSALFNLLAIDPASRPLLYWEGCHPDPIEGLAPGAPDPRLEATREQLARMLSNNPEFAKIHEVRADGPEECVQLLAHTLGGVQMGIEPLISPYGAWFERQDLRGAYAYYADLLRLLDWQRPGERWLLKSPAHLWAIDVLADLFPDVCIVWTHRNPLQIIGSYSSMVAALMRGREEVDPLALGPTVLEYLARSVERAMDARAASDPARVVDVSYDEFVSHPMAAVERIYAAFGLPLAGAVADAMRAHVAQNPQARHGKHDYSLAQYGLSAEQVRRRLAGYIERFELPVA